MKRSADFCLDGFPEANSIPSHPPSLAQPLQPRRLSKKVVQRQMVDISWEGEKINHGLHTNSEGIVLRPSIFQCVVS